MRDEKLHAVVARSTFRSQNVQNTPCSDHFWKLRCQKSARRCGAKHISKSKCTKHTILGPLLEVEMSKKPLWREAHFQLKMYCTKHTRFGPLLEVEMSKKCTPLWREAHFEVKMYKAHHVRTTFGHARFAWQAQGIVHLVKSEQNVRVLWHFQLQPPLNHTTLQYTTPQLQLQLHLHYIPVHCTPLQSPTLHSITLNYATLHNTTLHSITLNYATLHNTTLHSTTLHYITLHYLPLHFTTLHYTTLNYTTTTTATTLHYTPLH